MKSKIIFVTGNMTKLNSARKVLEPLGIEVDNEKTIIYKFIKENELDFEKIFEYANEINNLKPITKLYELGGKSAK